MKEQVCVLKRKRDSVDVALDTHTILVSGIYSLLILVFS